jgi:hypothetical protein
LISHESPVRTPDVRAGDAIDDPALLAGHWDSMWRYAAALSLHRSVFATLQPRSTEENRSSAE